MKRFLFLTALLMLVLSNVNAQTNNSQEKRVTYCELLNYNYGGYGKLKVLVDFGNLSKGSYSVLCDNDGKKIKFKTIIEAINKMADCGWRVIESYHVSAWNYKITHYLMEKVVTSDEQITEGLVLKPEKEPYRMGKKGDDMY